MLEIADELDRLDHAKQRAFALCIVERMCIAKSDILDPVESQSFADIHILIEEIWEYVREGIEMTSDEYEDLRIKTNSARPPAVVSISMRDIFWTLKSTLKVFRGREHVYEIARLGIELVSQLQLNDRLETHNQLRIITHLDSLVELNAKGIEELRERIRELPIATGDAKRAEHRD